MGPVRADVVKFEHRDIDHRGPAPMWTNQELIHPQEISHDGENSAPKYLSPEPNRARLDHAVHVMGARWNIYTYLWHFQFCMSDMKTEQIVENAYIYIYMYVYIYK